MGRRIDFFLSIPYAIRFIAIILNEWLTYFGNIALISLTLIDYLAFTTQLEQLVTRERDVEVGIPTKLACSEIMCFQLLLSDKNRESPISHL